jgi:hypothetical protein
VHNRRERGLCGGNSEDGLSICERYRIIMWRCWEPYDAVELMIQFNTRHVTTPELGRDFDGVGRFADSEDFLFGDAHNAHYTWCVSCKEDSNMHFIRKKLYCVPSTRFSQAASIFGLGSPLYIDGESSVPLNLIGLYAGSISFSAGAMQSR